MNKWGIVYLWKRLDRIREIEAAFGWTTGDKLDHSLILQLEKEAREIETVLAR